MKVLSFSGGQTSGYMLRREIDRIGLDAFRNEFLVVFENTGREHDETLNFVHAVETSWGIPVIWLEYTRVPATSILPLAVPEGRKRTNLLKQADQGLNAHWFRRVDYETAARIGSPGPFDELLGWANVLPNVRTRMCSVQLKVRTRDRFLRSIGVDQFEAYIGIRADESHRALEIKANVDRYETPVFPLLEDGITKEDVDSFWNGQPFKLNIPNEFGNCDLCFLKAKWKREMVARSNPKQAQWWADRENDFVQKATGSGRFFRSGFSYSRMLAELDEPTLFDADDQDVPCSCAVGGYRLKLQEGVKP